MIKQDRSDKSSSIDLCPLHQALGGRRGHQALGGKQGHQGETDLKKKFFYWSSPPVPGRPPG